MSDLNLLLCPFCGGKPVLSKTPNMHIVECNNEACGSNPDALAVSESEVIAAWNRRAAPIAAQLDQDAERTRGQRENAEFTEWWNRAQACPEHNLITENAAHAAWQERARRAAPAAAQLDAELPPLPDYELLTITADMVGSQLAVYRDEKMREIVAPYAERIRLLERERDKSYEQVRRLMSEGSDIITVDGRKYITAQVRDLIEELGEAKVRIDGRPAGTAPEGWKLVPVCATDEMLEEGRLRYACDPDRSDYGRIADTYESMIAAAPSPQENTK